MNRRAVRVGWLCVAVLVATACDRDAGAVLDPELRPELQHLPEGQLDALLVTTLTSHGFTGTVESERMRLLGRPLDPPLVEAGRLLFFDPITSLSGDNSCSGCHAPNAGFGGTQSIAIGVENNGVVGPDRAGPRNFRRSPTVANTALFPRIMLDSRFESLSGDPFDGSQGFFLDAPEGTSLSHMPHLLAAQAFMPVVDRSEMAGFDFEGSRDEMRAVIARRVDATRGYRRLFARAFGEVREGAPITFEHIARAFAEFQLSLLFADAPIDAYARGRRKALSADEKRGALLFFGKAGCVDCHAVDVPSASGDEMFTDYRHYVAGVPQIVPARTNVDFHGPGGDEDFGREAVTGNPDHRYAFRTSPLRNVGIQPFFMHNGAFATLEEALQHHLDPIGAAPDYRPDLLDPDLRRLGPLEPVLERVDRRLAEQPRLTEAELGQLARFLRCGLLDRDATPERLRHLVPGALPSGMPVQAFQFAHGPSAVAECARTQRRAPR